MPLPRWVEPQLSKLVAKAPTGPNWVHEIKFDGYRMAAPIERGKVQLLTRSGLDWTAKYPATAVALVEREIKRVFELTPRVETLELGTLAREFEASVKAPRIVDRRG